MEKVIHHIGYSLITKTIMIEQINLPKEIIFYHWRQPPNRVFESINFKHYTVAIFKIKWKT